MFIVSCDSWKVSPDALTPPSPSVSAKIIQVDVTSARIEINIENKAGTEITEIGFYLSSKPQSFYNDSIYLKYPFQKIIEITASNLRQDTIYYLTPYVKNHTKVYKGEIATMRTSKTPLIPFNPNLTYGSVNDIDGNTYKTIQIGNQIWMAENLRVTRFRNGDLIPTVSDYNLWINSDSPAQCPYDYSGSKDTISKYGRYYNWKATADSRGLAPNGWHIPMEYEWRELQMYLSKNNYSISKENMSYEIGKSLATTRGWEAYQAQYYTIGCEPQKNNKSGFTALPSGKYELQNSKRYYKDCYWWCDVWDTLMVYQNPSYMNIDYSTNQLGSGREMIRTSGYCIRCVKD